LTGWAHVAVNVTGLGLEFDFTAVTVRHNATANHQTQRNEVE
jgi:hypothetical protein